ncbi:MAG TPA: Rne/Rng family ribonuclease [Deltaproteobacteria bacterium]|nr:Rne/Rng family ribonuclease [Deltaproteobacteria bacterium]
MATELIINSTFYETRVAVVENGTTAEFYVERHAEQNIAGNIYKGRVIRVLPGMQAAFVDIGLEKAGFLYVSDVCDQMDDIANYFKSKSPAETLDSTMQEEVDSLHHGSMNEKHIEDCIQEGQEVLVQVSKEPLGSKGARITSLISIPGRHLVLMPMVDHIGVSRRIENEKERKRLKDIIINIKPSPCGFIVRTACEGEEKEKIKAEMEFLLKLWKNIQKQGENAPAPSLVYQDLDITLRAVRDLFTQEVDRLIIDSEKEYEKVLNFIDTFSPSLKSSVVLYEGHEPIFDAYGIEMEIQRALGKKVWLKSGGYIVIETTEALTSIDVNTGRYVGCRNLEETILKTNLEAVKEIACQLRLRNIGGIIIIDFIDMEKESNREKVFQALTEALKNDKSKTNILRMSELGLIEMTRKRTRESIGRVLREPCFYCDGEGYLKSKLTVCYEILRELQRERKEFFGRSIMVTAHSAIANLLCDEESNNVEKMEEELQARIIIKGDPHLHLEQYEIVPF